MSTRSKRISRISVIKCADIKGPTRTASIPLQLWDDRADASAAHRPNHQAEGSSATRSGERLKFEKELAALQETMEQDHTRALQQLAAENAQLLADCQKRCDEQRIQIRNSMEIALSAASASVDDFFRSIQPALVELASSVAETLTGSALRPFDTNVIIASVSWAAEELARDQSIDIYLNPETLSLLSEQVSLESLTHGARIRWHARPELELDDWIASSPETSIRRVRAEMLSKMSTIISESVATANAQTTPVANGEVDDEDSDRAPTDSDT